MSRRTLLPVALAAILTLALAGCSGEDGGGDATVAPPTDTPTATAAADTSTPEPTSTPDAALDATEIFATISPSLAFLETDLSTGSGFVFRDGLLVTNAHVVWPFEAVRVVFPDGRETLEAPVIAIDQLADLAIVDIRGADDGPPPLAVADGESLPIGSELYLIGYPGEVETFPMPTITRGILSRFRSLPAFALDFLQTDAVIVGGQSGGALVSEAGDVVGVSGLATEGFALVTSAPDVLERLERMLAGEDTDELAYRDIRLGDPVERKVIAIDHFFDEPTFVFDGESGTEFTVELTSDADVLLTVIGPDGFVEATADETQEGAEILTFETDFVGPYFVIASSFALGTAVAEFSSSVELREWDDPDDGERLRVGDRYVGHTDYPGDQDWFELQLRAGDEVTISVRSVLLAPSLLVDVPENPADPLAADQGSAGGLFGTDATLTFMAEESRSYLVVVSDFDAWGPGGYELTVE